MNLPNYNDLYTNGTIIIKKTYCFFKIRIYVEEYKFKAKIFNLSKPFKKLRSYIKIYKRGNYIESDTFIITFTGLNISVVFLKNNTCLGYGITFFGKIYKNPQLIGECKWKKTKYKLAVNYI